MQPSENSAEPTEPVQPKPMQHERVIAPLPGMSIPISDAPEDDTATDTTPSLDAPTDDTSPSEAPGTEAPAVPEVPVSESITDTAVEPSNAPAEAAAAPVDAPVAPSDTPTTPESAASSEPTPVTVTDPEPVASESPVTPTPIPVSPPVVPTGGTMMDVAPPPATPAATAPVPTPASIPTPAPAPAAAAPAPGSDIVDNTPVIGATAPAPQPVAVVAGSGGLVEDGPPVNLDARRSFMKPLLIALVGLSVLGLGSAAAFVGVIIPNKPENVLRTALVNSAQSQYVNFDGSVQASGAGASYKLGMTGNSDAVAKAAESKIAITVAGVPLNLEAKLVNKNVYVKVGDLKTVEDVLGAFDPSLTPSVEKINQVVANKWIVIDSTLLDQANVSCELKANMTLTKDDMKLLETAYSKNAFTSITKTSSDSTGKKLDISIDNDKFVAFANGKTLQQLSFAKALDACGSQSKQVTNDQTLSSNHKKTNLSVWVKDKHISQIAYDYSKSGTSANVTLKLSYKKVAITAPTGAVPAAQVIADVQKALGPNDALGLGSLLGGLNTSKGTINQEPSSSTQNNVKSFKDEERIQDINAIQTHLEAYYAQNGHYPSLKQLNDPAFVKSEMEGLDAQALVDPGSTDHAARLQAVAAANIYAYYPYSDAEGAGACVNNVAKCSKYTLTATLDAPSNGASSYIKQSLN